MRASRIVKKMIENAFVYNEVIKVVEHTDNVGYVNNRRQE